LDVNQLLFVFITRTQNLLIRNIKAAYVCVFGWHQLNGLIALLYLGF